jgi:hypothetical protein
VRTSRVLHFAILRKILRLRTVTSAGTGPLGLRQQQQHSNHASAW